MPVAQEEARSVSENMKWRIKKNFEEGIPWGALLYGYDVIDSKYYVNEKEAEVVRMIFNLYLEGLGKGTHSVPVYVVGTDNKLTYTSKTQSVRVIID